MAYADFDYYKNDYHGIIIDQNNEYAYFAERASDRLALFVNKLPKTDEANEAVKKCTCAIADILFGDFKAGKNGVQKANSESVAGYYSVSYSAPSSSEIVALCNRQIGIYLGKWLCGARAVMW